MRHIGIDFSINSPAVCILEENNYRFVGFYNEEGKKFEKKDPSDYKYHRHILLLDDIDIIHFSRRRKHEDYTVDQRQKIEDSHTLGTLISETVGQGPCKVGIEGYSYGSKGNSFIDLISFNSVMRHVLYTTTDADIMVKTPSQIKILAGKGNANKGMMYEYFCQNTTKDPNLEKSSFWKWCVEQKFIGEIPKPIDDLVDAYFISRSVQLSSLST
jgi:hypothetical protein